MAIRIISPMSTIIDVPSPEILVQWQDSTDGQEAYELQYKFKKANVWSTCGKVFDSNARSASLNTIYNLVGVDFYEVHYRIVIYYNGPNNKGFVQGIETSNAYSIIFRHGIANTLKLYDGSEVLEYPLYDQVSINKNKTGNEVEVINISLDDSGNTINKLPLVEDDSVIKSDINIFISDTDTKRVAGSYAAFTDTGIYGTTYMNQNTYYQEIAYDYNYIDVYRSRPIYSPIPYYNYLIDYSYRDVYRYKPLYDYNPIYDYYGEPGYADKYNYRPSYDYNDVYGTDWYNIYYLIYDYRKGYSEHTIYSERTAYKYYISGYETITEHYEYYEGDYYYLYDTYKYKYYYNEIDPLTYGSDYKYAGYYYNGILGYYFYDYAYYYSRQGYTYQQRVYDSYHRYTYYQRAYWGAYYDALEYQIDIENPIPIFYDAPRMSEYYYATSYYTYRDSGYSTAPYYKDYYYYTKYDGRSFYDKPLYDTKIDYYYYVYEGTSYGEYNYEYWTGQYAYWYRYYTTYFDYTYSYIDGQYSYRDGYYTYYNILPYITNYYDYIFTYIPEYDYKYSYISGYFSYIDGYNYAITGYEYYYDYTYKYNYIAYQYIYNFYYLYYNS